MGLQKLVVTQGEPADHVGSQLQLDIKLLVQIKLIYMGCLDTPPGHDGPLVGYSQFTGSHQKYNHSDLLT